MNQVPVQRLPVFPATLPQDGVSLCQTQNTSQTEMEERSINKVNFISYEIQQDQSSVHVL